jgi:MFS family permease
MSLFLFSAVISSFNLFHQHLVTFARTAGFEGGRICIALCLSMLGAALGALLVGYLGDRCGGVFGGSLILLLGGVAIFLFLLSGHFPCLFLPAAVLHGVASSGVGVIVPLLTREFFGRGEYTRILSRVSIGAPLASVTVMPLYGLLFDRLGSYTLALCLLLGALLLALLCLLVGARSARRLRS